MLSLLIKLIWRQKSTLFGFLVTSILIGFFARLTYQKFIYLQAQNIQGLSVFNEIILPLSGLVIFCQLIMSLLASLALFPSFGIAGQVSLLEQASISRTKLVIDAFKSISLFAFWPLFNFILIILLLSMLTQFDITRLGLTLLGLFLLMLINNFLVLSIALTSRRILIAIIKCFIVFGFLITIESVVNYYSLDYLWRGIFLPFYNFREGLLVYADLVNYLGWLLVSFSVCVFFAVKKLTIAKLKIIVSFVLGLIFILSTSLVPGKIDITDNQRNSLSQRLIEELKQIDKPLQIIAVIDKQEDRDEILRGFNLLKEGYKNSQLSFQTRQSLGPQLEHSGEFIQFNLGKLQQNVAYPFSQDIKQIFESAIIQMLRRKQQWITFIEGHKEASLFGKKPSDFSQLYASLTDLGWSVASQNLAKMPIIADNTELLVIASSKTEWLTTEVDLVMSYLHKGGNLLLLLDPDSIVPKQFNQFLGLSRYPGTLIDRNGFEGGTPHPAIVIVNKMSSHPSVSQINSLLAFPWSSGLLIDSENRQLKGKIEKILTTHSGVWNELDVKEKEIFLNKGQGELQKEFILAIAYSNPEKNQKIIVVGDSHFASDSAINNYANRQFSLNLISWLTNNVIQELMVNHTDTSIKPTPWGHFTMNWFFCLIFPCVILLVWLLSEFAKNKTKNKI